MKLIYLTLLASLTLSCGHRSEKLANENNRRVVVPLTKDEFEPCVDTSQFTLVNFHAPWCPACNQLAPELNNFVNQEDVTSCNNLNIRSFDLTESPELAKELGISSIPCLILFQNGLEVERVVGYQPDKLNQFLTGHIFQQSPRLQFNEEEATAINDAQLSEMIGFLVHRKCKNLSLNIDTNQMIKGIQKSQKRGSAPVTDHVFAKAFTTAYENAIEKTALDSLHRANVFLVKNGKESDVQSLIPGKLQSRTIQSGTGLVPRKESRVLVQLHSEFEDGAVHFQSEMPVALTCHTLIPGLMESIVQMREGEIRELFIHPDLAFGISCRNHPNSLLKVKIELLSISADEKAIEISNIFELQTPLLNNERLISDLELFLGNS